MPYRFGVSETKTEAQEGGSGAGVTDSPQFQVTRIRHALASAGEPP